MGRCREAEGEWRPKCRAIDEKMVDKRGLLLGENENVRDYPRKQGDFLRKVGVFRRKVLLFLGMVDSLFGEVESKRTKGVGAARDEARRSTRLRNGQSKKWG